MAARASLSSRCGEVLLYTATYPQLIATLCALLAPRGGVRPQLLMEWDRRLKGGADRPFFDALPAAGLDCEHLGRRMFRIAATAAEDGVGTTRTTGP